MANWYKFIISTVFFGIMVNAQAQVSGDTSVCTGDLVTYSVPMVSGASYGWNVSGGSIAGSSTGDSVLVNWGVPGTGSLVVMVTPPNSSPVFYSLTVIIHPGPSPAITHAPYPGCPPEQGEHAGGSPDQGGKDPCEKVCKYATITYSTTLNTGSTYSWVVSGALTVIGAATNTVTVTWDATATGSLTVFETNQWCCTDSAYLCIKKMDLPLASFTHQLNVCKFSNVAFNNTSTGAVAFQWYFGDGGSSTLANPTHSYANGGTYTITLIAISECYCRDTVTSTLTVSSDPGPEISCPSTLCAFDTATYSTSSSGCNYNWFAIGGTILGPSNQQSVTVAWGAGQIGHLGLFVTGCTGLCTDTTWIDIPLVPSVATITGPNKVCPGACEEFSLPLFSGAIYTWSLNNGSCGQITDSSCCNKVQICWPAYSMNCVDTLTVSYWDAFLNCGGTATFLIRVRPRLSLFGQNQGCANGTSNFYAFPGIPSNWNVYPAGPVISGNPGPSVSVNWNGLTGTYLVTAVPVNPNAVCNDSAFITITVIAPPQAPLITGDTVSCPNNTIQYCAAGPGTIHWIITGGTPSTGIGNCINVTWGNTPPFTVQAYSQMPLSPYCSSDTTSQAIHTVISIPPATFAGNHTACANATVAYFSSSLYMPGTSFNWTLTPSNAGAIIGGQGTSAIQVEWGNNAPQTVVLSLASSICGLTQVDTFHIYLSPPPNPSIVQLGTLCPGVNAQLQAVGGIFTAYQWSGPAGYSSAVNPTTISLPGLYQVTVTDAGGCTALTQLTVFNIGGPQASISALGPLQYCIGSSYSVGLCALGNPNYSYAWSNGPVTQCNYVNSPGSYFVTVTDFTTGCYSVSNILTVAEDSCLPDTGICIPTGSVSFTHSSCNPKVFTNTSVSASSFTWYFGDLATSNLPSPSHYYNQAGFYTVTLYGYVPDASGTDSCLLMDTALIEIPLLAQFSFTSGCYGSPVCFTDQSVTTVGNVITGWSWNFGDANTSNLQNPCHTYALPGTYLVTLTISNPNCTTSFTDTVVIAPQPLAAFTAGSVNCVNTAVGFTDNSTTNINYWNWDFGNGGTSLNQNPSQSYASPGFYTVTLIVHDIYGCYDTVSQNIFINTPLANGSITAFPDTVACAGTNVILSAPACVGCTYSWSNGSTNDSIIVTSTGIYAVIISDSNGCTYSTLIHVIVHQPPFAVISGTKNNLCLGEFASLSVPYNINWLYNWISNDTMVNGAQWQAVNAFPSSPGIYTYQVAITDTLTGCSDTTLPFILTVHAPPVAPTVIALGPTTVCKGDTITLVVSHPDPTVTFTWSTGETNDTIRVTKNGCLSVTATDTNGCTAITPYCVTVNPLPEVCSFWEGCYDTCSPYTIQGPPGAASYQWLLNGNPLPGDTLPTLVASLSGAYSVIVTNTFGCVDTTGVLNLSLHPCPDSLCAELIVDSVFCDPSTGMYVLQYQVVNLSNQLITEVNLMVQAPNLALAYAPNTVYVNLNPGDTSGTLSALIYNGMPGSTLCFKSHISAYDIEGNEVYCCNSDSVCFTLPECVADTGCCYFDFLDDTIWCETESEGTSQYHFSLLYEYCGTVNITLAGGGILDTGDIFYMSGNIGYLSGIYIPGNDTLLCLTVTVHDSTHYCIDTTYCFDLPPCPPPSLPCMWEYPHTLCEGSSATFQYGIIVPGATYTWQFPGGIPSTAAGMGPHTVYYSSPGTYAVQLTITNSQGSTLCQDSITVVPKPVASILQSGTSLLALPAGMSYQWYYAPVSPANLILGANNQSFTPTTTNKYCVVVTNGQGCSDTLCSYMTVPEPGCCEFQYLGDSVWCEATLSGGTLYHFTILVEGCGDIEIAPLSTGNISLNNPYILQGDTTVISGTYSFSGGMLCLLLMVHDSNTYCADTTVCLDLPPCPVVIGPCDYLSVNFNTFISGYLVNFYNTSITENGMIIIATHWNFGDSLSGLSNTSSLQYPSHIYSQPGTYTVCLVVVGMYPGTTIFCVKQICYTITIIDPYLEICGSLNALFAHEVNGLSVHFINQSTAGNGLLITEYNWNFGDPDSGADNYSYLQNPDHQFTAPGIYTVCLVIIALQEGTSVMCVDTLCLSITILPFSSVSGEVTYDNAIFSPLSNIPVSLYSGNTLVATATTTSTGHYEFDSLAPGVYHIHCASDAPWGGVNAADALLILKHFVGMTFLHGLPLAAANVDGSVSVNATDALLTARRFVGMINSFAVGDWVFEKPNIILNANMNFVVNIKGLCYGDVNGSNTLQGLKNGPSLVLETQGEQNAGISREVVIPVRIKDPSAFSALSLVLKLPDHSMEITGVRSVADQQNLVWYAHEDELRVAWWTLEDKQWQGNEEILYLSLLLKEGFQAGDDCCFSLGAESTLADVDGHEITGNTLLIPRIAGTEEAFSLGQNVPNPFNGTTQISYTLPAKGHVRLVAYDVVGKEVKILLDGEAASGQHTVMINASDFNDGMYFYSLYYTADSRKYMLTKRMVVE
jgi:PKD repeat protein